MPVSSTTRVKSAIVLALMVDGGCGVEMGSALEPVCVDFPPVRIVRKRGAMAHQSAVPPVRQSPKMWGQGTVWSRCQSRVWKTKVVSDFNTSAPGVSGNRMVHQIRSP